MYFLAKIRADQDHFLRVSVQFAFSYTGKEFWQRHRAAAVWVWICCAGEGKTNHPYRAQCHLLSRCHPCLLLLGLFPRNGNFQRIPVLALWGSVRPVGHKHLAAVFNHCQHMTWSSCSVFCLETHKRNIMAPERDLAICRTDSAWQ